MSLKLIGLMRRANAVSPGQDKAIQDVKSGKAKLLIIPSDASKRTIRDAENAVKGKSAQLTTVPYTNDELSKAIGLDSCTMLSVNDKGFADALLKSLKKESTEGM